MKYIQMLNDLGMLMDVMVWSSVVGLIVSTTTWKLIAACWRRVRKESAPGLQEVSVSRRSFLRAGVVQVAVNATKHPLLATMANVSTALTVGKLINEKVS